MFGLMGDANLFMVDSFVRECGGNFIPAAHEGSTILMAAAYAHVSGNVGVATVTHGPGLTNCVTTLVEATRMHTPMVILAGDTPVANPRHLQSIDQRELVKVTGAGFVQLRSPTTVTEDVAQAFYRTRVERRPIVLNMPADFMWQEVTHDMQVLDVFTAPGGVAEGDTLDNAIGMRKWFVEVVVLIIQTQMTMIKKQSKNRKNRILVTHCLKGDFGSPYSCR